ncbi:hypothetical protein Y10_05770 [Neptunitalea sp. Y10]|uniref:DUF3575 domain-containing protein n=2 Tax=Neptunitalea lumnitzerae TaxID=2965509 RepID=A0ABQ5MFN6_9FLAO|nr:hypothetical protein Y10_05770 [Neptunitalea sp. Y10]
MLLIVLGLCKVQAQNGQNTSYDNNEVSLNLLYTALGLPEVTYERIISDNGSIGLSAAISLNDEHIDINYISTAFYRFYFGKKRAAGFYLEGNVTVFEETVEKVWDLSYNHEDINKVGYGMGVSVGAKFLNNHNWTGTIYGGLGGNFADYANAQSAYLRAGISIGKRF